MPLTMSLNLAPGIVERATAVECERGSDPLQFDERCSVRWTPEGGGPYPDFAGEIVLRKDSNTGRTVLELSGEYAPPLGKVGKAFDMVIGAKIAAHTARRLLCAIGNALQPPSIVRKAS